MHNSENIDGSENIINNIIDETERGKLKWRWEYGYLGTHRKGFQLRIRSENPYNNETTRIMEIYKHNYFSGNNYMTYLTIPDKLFAIADRQKKDIVKRQHKNLLNKFKDTFKL